MDVKIDKKLRRYIILVLITGGVIAGAVFLLVNQIAWYNGVTEAERLKSLSMTEQLEAAGTLATSPSLEAGAVESEPAEPRQILPKYWKLLELNDEVSGWIKIDGTRIDYPLLQHDDNDYYLHMSAENKKSKRGSVYMDYRNDRELKDSNTMVYGHNMKDGSMFKDLVRYKNEDFFYSHGIIHMDSLYEENDWQVFSVYVVDADKETINPDYPDTESFLKDLIRFRDRSMYKTDVELNSDDRIITLVTCSYETSNSRTIVHAKYIG